MCLVCWSPGVQCTVPKTKALCKGKNVPNRPLYKILNKKFQLLICISLETWSTYPSGFGCRSYSKISSCLIKPDIGKKSWEPLSQMFSGHHNSHRTHALCPEETCVTHLPTDPGLTTEGWLETSSDSNTAQLRSAQTLCEILTSKTNRIGF